MQEESDVDTDIGNPLSFCIILKNILAFNITTDDSCTTHTLVEFVEEGCTAVVPLQWIIEESFEAGYKVTVLWNNRKACPAVFLCSGNVSAFKIGAHHNAYKISSW